MRTTRKSPHALIAVGFVLGCLVFGPLLNGQSALEQAVLQKIQGLVGTQTSLNFSSLYNNDQFDEREKAFLSRLYEIFFQVPTLLKDVFDKEGTILTRNELGERFGVSSQSIELLLHVMSLDPRVPPLFTRNPATQEIASLNVENIAAFAESLGDVRLTDWVGRALPSFDLETLEGTSISTRDLKGKSGLIYFWYSGCPPCVRLTPHLVELAKQFPESRFRIIGMNADRLLELGVEDETRSDYLRERDIEFTNAHLDQATRSAFGAVNIFPTLFFFGKEGRIEKHLINYQDLETLERIVLDLTSSAP